MVWFVSMSFFFFLPKNARNEIEISSGLFFFDIADILKECYDS